MTARAAGGSASRANEYADVPEMFRELVGLPAGSPEFQRHRDKIVQRCLPLADHIARRFEVAANRVTTLFRSRGSGWSTPRFAST